MELRILGPVEAVVGDRPVALRRPKQRALLAFLALHVGEVVSTDRLIDALWRGPPLEGREFEFFAQVELPPLLLDRLAAHEDLLDAELDLGRHADVVGEIEALVEEHHFDERLRAQLAKALYGAGRQSDALDALRVARRLFRDE